MIGLVILLVLVLLVLAVAFLRLGAAAGYDETGAGRRSGSARPGLRSILSPKRRRESGRQRPRRKPPKRKSGQPSRRRTRKRPAAKP